MRICPVCGEATRVRTCPRDGSDTFRSVGISQAEIDSGVLIDARYRVQKVIGRGGFGTVYAAQDERTGQELAIKVLSKAFAGDNDSIVRRFVQEAATTSRLTHGNTIRVFDYGRSTTGELFLVMERLDGESLRGRLAGLKQRGERMSVSEVVRIGSGVLLSLTEAHKVGLVHRDLKPENIFLHRIARRAPVVKVLDFGVVKELGKGMTQAGEIVGTPTHMSPEQVREQPLTGRSDLYSLGVVLYECVSGQLPFSDENVLNLLMQHILEPVPSLAGLAPDAPEALVQVIETALQKEPEQRWADAREMRLALMAVPVPPDGRRAPERPLPKVRATGRDQRRVPRSAEAVLREQQTRARRRRLHLAETQPLPGLRAPDDPGPDDDPGE